MRWTIRKNQAVVTGVPATVTNTYRLVPCSSPVRAQRPKVIRRSVESDPLLKTYVSAFTQALANRDGGPVTQGRANHYARS